MLPAFAAVVGPGGFFFQAEDGIRDDLVTGVQTCALPISACASWRLVASFDTDRVGEEAEGQIAVVHGTWNAPIGFQGSLRRPAGLFEGVCLDRKSVV